MTNRRPLVSRLQASGRHLCENLSAEGRSYDHLYGRPPHPRKRRLDLERIEVLAATHLSPELRGSASDIVLKVRRRGPVEASGEPASAFITFAVEHQSRDERFITLRQLHYATRLWDDWLRAGAYAPAADLPSPPRLGARRPRFIRSSTYRRRRWTRCPLVPLTGRWRTSPRSGDEPVSETVLEIMQNAPGPAADALFNRWLTQLAPLRTEPGGPSTLAEVLCYLFYVGAVPRERVVQAAEELPAPAKEEFMTIAEQYFEEGVQKGLEKGLEKGRQEGRQHLALVRGHAACVERRYASGRSRRGRRTRSRASSTPELERWVEAILTAERLNDLFH